MSDENSTQLHGATDPSIVAILELINKTPRHAIQNNRDIIVKALLAKVRLVP